MPGTQWKSFTRNSAIQSHPEHKARDLAMVLRIRTIMRFFGPSSPQDESVRMADRSGFVCATHNEM